MDRPFEAKWITAVSRFYVIKMLVNGGGKLIQLLQKRSSAYLRTAAKLVKYPGVRPVGGVYFHCTHTALRLIYSSTQYRSIAEGKNETYQDTIYKLNV